MQECEHRIIKGAVIKIGRPSLYAVACRQSGLWLVSQ